jgi:hypothetical protein
MTYTAVLTPGEDGIICAQIAEVPEAISQGRTLEEARPTSARRSSGAPRARRSPARAGDGHAGDRARLLRRP